MSCTMTLPPTRTVQAESQQRPVIHFPTNPKVDAYVFQTPDGERQFWHKDKDGSWHRERLDAK